jgi:hypothetical protein
MGDWLIRNVFDGDRPMPMRGRDASGGGVVAELRDVIDLRADSRSGYADRDRFSALFDDRLTETLSSAAEPVGERAPRGAPDYKSSRYNLSDATNRRARARGVAAAPPRACRAKRQ